VSEYEYAVEYETSRSLPRLIIPMSTRDLAVNIAQNYTDAWVLRRTVGPRGAFGPWEPAPAEETTEGADDA
jgi:hypothetical protein